MKFSYDLIEPLLAYSETDGSKVNCEFQVPGTHEIVQSSARMKRSNTIQGQVQRQVTRMGSNMVRREASRLVRQALGGGMLGRIGSSTIRTASRPMQQSLQYSAEDKREAIVEAFKRVADSFHFDTGTNSWTSPPAEPESTLPAGKMSIRSRGRRSQAESQLAGAPLKSHFEKEVLARLLVELANVDGEIKPEEKEFLQAVVGEEFGSIDELLGKDPVSQIECEELPDKSKETIYMLAWVMSLVDFDMDPSEKEVLLEYADMMGLSDSQVKDITQKAKMYLLEKSISVETSREELFEIADQLDLDHQDAERCLIQLKKKA